MKKQIKIIIAAGIVLLLLVGAIIFLLTLPDVQSDTVGETSTGAATLISKSSKNIEQITVDNGGGKYTLLLYDVVVENSDESSSESSGSSSSTESSSTALIFTMQEHDQYILDQDKTDALAYVCANLAATRTINSKGKEDSEYGLDSPRATVKVRFSDGSEKTVEVGNDAPGDEGTYVRMDNASTIYLVDTDSISAMLIEMLQMFDKTVIDELSDGDNLTSMNVSGSGRKTPLTLENSALSTLSAFYMSSPSRAACDGDAIETLCDSSIFPLVADSVVKIDVTESDVEKYGLSDPYYILDILTEQRESRIIVSEPDDNNNCYIMEDGGKAVYKIASDEIGFMSSDGSDYVTSSVIYPSEPKLKSAVFTYDGTKNEYTLTHKTIINEDEKEIISTTVHLAGNKIAENRFETLLRNISTLTRSSKAPKADENAEPIFTAEFVYENDKGTDTLKLFEKDDKAVIVLNNVSVGTTDLETAKTLAADAKALSENKDFESLVKDEEASDTSESTESSK